MYMPIDNRAMTTMMSAISDMGSGEMSALIVAGDLRSLTQESFSFCGIHTEERDSAKEFFVLRCSGVMVLRDNLAEYEPTLVWLVRDEKAVAESYRNRNERTRFDLSVSELFELAEEMAPAAGRSRRRITPGADLSGESVARRPTLSHGRARRFAPPRKSGPPHAEPGRGGRRRTRYSRHPGAQSP